MNHSQCKCVLHILAMLVRSLQNKTRCSLQSPKIRLVVMRAKVPHPLEYEAKCDVSHCHMTYTECHMTYTQCYDLYSVLYDLYSVLYDLYSVLWPILSVIWPILSVIWPILIVIWPILSVVHSIPVKKEACLWLPWQPVLSWLDIRL